MSSAPFVVNGWTVYFHPVFAARFDGLLRRAEKARAAGRAGDPDLKLLAAVARLVESVVPADPDHADFRLAGDLARFRRAKGRGLPARHRLFWIFSTRARAIVFLYLNDESTLRKAGARSDPYVRFRTLVRRGEIGDDFESNAAAWRRARGRP